MTTEQGVQLFLRLMGHRRDKAEECSNPEEELTYLLANLEDEAYAMRIDKNSRVAARIKDLRDDIEFRFGREK